jgi:iron(III) transport system substrate-binding protein
MRHQVDNIPSGCYQFTARYEEMPVEEIVLRAALIEERGCGVQSPDRRLDALVRACPFTEGGDVMKKLIVLVVLILFMAPFVFAAGQEAKGPIGGQALAEKAKAEGKVTFYANITSVEPILEDFAKRYGVKAEYTRLSTTKFIATILTEHAAGKLTADVLQAPMPVLELLKEKGVLASYTSPAAAGYPKWTNKDGKIQSFGIEYAALIYNKELVKPADVPKKYEDLADPKWKGKIVMADPSSHPTTISWLVGL